MTWIDLNHLVKDTIHHQNPMARANKIHLEYQSEGNDIQMMGREDAVQTTLTNLIGNAIKYNRPDGKVIVTLQREQDSVHIRIIDTGIGIPADKLPFIFDPFYRIQEKRTVEGSGLGLALVKKLVELHDGTIHVQSKSGEGTVFHVIFLIKSG